MITQTELVSDPELVARMIKDDGTFPNNGKIPVVIYKAAFRPEGNVDPAFIEKTFSKNSWHGSWRNGIYPFHHYHSTAHEVLGIYKGTVQVQLGGEKGQIFGLSAGDVVVLPAGVAHKNIQSSHDFRVVGAYPEDQDWDMNYGKDDERPKTDQQIMKVPLPHTDPLFGKNGPLEEHWRQSAGNSKT